jgi:hypothetical protein
MLSDNLRYGLPDSTTWSDILQAPRLREKILELDPSFADVWSNVIVQLCTVHLPLLPYYFRGRDGGQRVDRGGESRGVE